MATVKKYNLAGLNANVELGKQGSYITGSSGEIGFYANGGALQKLKIADATELGAGLSSFLMLLLLFIINRLFFSAFSVNTSSTSIPLLS